MLRLKTHVPNMMTLKLRYISEQTITKVPAILGPGSRIKILNTFLGPKKEGDKCSAGRSQVHAYATRSSTAASCALPPLFSASDCEEIRQQRHIINDFSITLTFDIPSTVVYLYFVICGVISGFFFSNSVN